MPTAPKTTTKPNVTLAGWKSSKVHNILLPSNTRIDITIPDLADIIESGELPQDLLKAALATAAGSDDQELTPEVVRANREFQEHLIVKTVVSPKLTIDDVKDLPVEDRDLIFQIATRQRDFDAEYKHIGGLSQSKAWATFRGLPGSDSTVED